MFEFKRCNIFKCSVKFTVNMRLKRIKNFVSVADQLGLLDTRIKLA